MRYEIKIPISEKNLLLFYNWRDSIKGLKKVHQDRKVNSIYYDEKNLTFANDNLIGVSDRVKTRLRWYNNEDNFAYEFKFKKNKIGNKIILPSNQSLVKISFDKAFINKNYEFKSNPHKKKVLDITSKYNLKPIVKVVYNRSYYEFMKKIRLTFDTPSEFQVFSNNSFRSIKKDTLFVLELKFHPNNYFLAQKLLGQSQFVPKRFSKYLRGLAINDLANYI